MDLDNYVRALSHQYPAGDEHQEALEEGKETTSDSLEECPYADFLSNIHKERPIRKGRKESLQEREHAVRPESGERGGQHKP